MPKSLELFGRHIRRECKFRQGTFRKYQVTKLVPNNAMGRVPSAASQMSLWHNDDFNAYWKVSAFNTIFRKRTSPFTTRKEFKSDKLNSTVTGLRVTPSALYAIDDKGGFDDYVMRTPPEELRSNAGEKMRNLMYYYMENPQVKAWSLPWHVLSRKRDKADPIYAKYRYQLRKSDNEAKSDVSHSVYSPYYLPKTDAGLYPQRDMFATGKLAPKLNLWWKDDPKVETEFRRRLTEAKSFEEAHPDHREAGSYRKGEGAGGGGGQGRAVRPRSKTYRGRQLRPY